jgi:hypothetical protein
MILRKVDSDVRFNPDAKHEREGVGSSRTEQGGGSAWDMGRLAVIEMRRFSWAGVRVRFIVP